jgi:hypothetical protein
VEIIVALLRNNESPASEDWLPPKKSTVIFLRQTASRSKGSTVSSVMIAGAMSKGNCLDSELLCESAISRHGRSKTSSPDA